MITVNEPLAPATFAAAWENCPWGMVAIDDDGHVRQVNPVFERCSGISAQAVLGIHEADFDALLASPLIEHRRVATAEGGLRAIHYILRVTTSAGHDQRLSRVAEILREPLASIYGFTELLLMQDYDEETRRGLTSTLLEQVELIANLINEKLDTRRPSASGQNHSAAQLKRQPGDTE